VSDLFPDFHIDKRMMLAEIDAELKMRAHVYPRLIGQGRLSQEAADRKIKVLEVVRRVVASVDPLAME
jgi:hypothetical protein